MFTYLKLKNFKSLLDVKINFTNKKHEPKKLILLYGENGSGKSNIASAFYVLAETTRTMDYRDAIPEILKDVKNHKNSDILVEILKDKFRDLQSIIKKCKTIGSNDNMILEFGFSVDGNSGSYTIETNDEKIISESLYFIIEKSKGCYFNLTESSKKLNPKVFKNQTLIDELNIEIEKYWGKHSFMAILFNQIHEKNKGYVKEKLSSNFWQVLTFLSSFSCNIKEGNIGERSRYGFSQKSLLKLKGGSIDTKDEKILDKTENFLNELFTRLYSDIKGVYYIKDKSEDKIKYKLYCKKLIGTEIRDIDFNLESTGTLQILDLSPLFLMPVNGYTTIIDEFDSGIHDLMVKNILTSLYKSITGQLILTTHNTLLMEKAVPPDSLYFIVINSDGNKEVLCLTDYNQRTHPNNNIRDLYLKGMYEGIPYMMDIDFDEMSSLLEE